MLRSYKQRHLFFPKHLYAFYTEWPKVSENLHSAQYKKHVEYIKDFWRWPSQNTFGMWTVLYWTRSSRTQFGVSINVWRLAGNTLNIACNFLHCNYQVHRDFLITLYYQKGNSNYISFLILVFQAFSENEIPIKNVLISEQMGMKVHLQTFTVLPPVEATRYWVGPRAGLNNSPLSENEENFMCVSPHRLDTTPTELSCLLIVFEKRK
jgi:hypothetical protein